MAITRAVVALPHLVSDDMSPQASSVLFSCSLVIVIIAVIPPYVWRLYVKTPGGPWR